MTETYSIDATPVDRIRADSVELTELAEHGGVGSGRFTVDDSAGTQAIVGQKDATVEQSAADPAEIIGGYVDVRSYRRGEERVDTAREIETELVDLNATLGFRLINSKTLSAALGGKRPAETVAERGAWLMASPFMSGLVADNGFCDFPAGRGMDAADYRNQFPGDVLADMALAAGGYNYFVYRDAATGEPSLWFGDPNASTAFTSDVRISNDLADIGGSTYAPSTDATLRRDPGKVKSHIVGLGALGSVVESRPATATTFNGERWGTFSNSNLKSEGKLRDEAQDMLWQLHTEEDVLECSITVPAANVNDLRAGQRTSCRFTHLGPEGYADWTWFRVLGRTIRPLTDDLYRITLRLSPQEAGRPAGAIVQSDFAFWGTGGSSFPPYSRLPNPPTIGNTLLVMISKRSGSAGAGTVNPPNTNAAQPRWGAGAWTQLPLDVGGFSTTYYEFTAGDGTRHGMSMFWKVVDSTSQTCVIPNDYQNVGVYELSGVDMTGATLARANNQNAATTLDIGTLGTLNDGDLAFMLMHENWSTAGPFPPLTAAPGWVMDWNRGNYPLWSGPTYPIVWMGHALGDGSTIDPVLTHPAPGLRWCGLAIKVPGV